MSPINIGFQLTLFGMGLVFLLLAVMALLIKLLLRTDSEESQPQAPEEMTLNSPADFDADSLAAIMVAVIRHRARRRKEAAPAMRQYKPETVHSRWVTVGRSQSTVNWQPVRRTENETVQSRDQRQGIRGLHK